MASGMDEPPHCCDNKDTDQDDAVVVHSRDSGGKYICWRYRSAKAIRDSCCSALTEAEHDVEENDECYSDAIYGKTRRSHPKRTPRYVIPSGEQMRSDG